MTKNEKMTKRLNEWRTSLEALEQKLTEMTLQIERQRGAIAAAEALLAMADDEVVVVTEGDGEQPADAPAAEQAM